MHGSELARETLLGDARGWDVWGAVLDDRFLHRGAYWFRHGTFDWNEIAPNSYVPEVKADDAAEAWHPEDTLLVPLRHSDGHLLGILGVDEPARGMRPGDDELDVLMAVAEHAALALQSAQEAAVGAPPPGGARAAAAGLVAADRDVLDRRRSCSRSATASTRARIPERLDRPARARHRPAGAAGVHGWDLDDPIINTSMSLDELAPLMAPEFEIEGCYLLTSEEAPARVDSSAHWVPARA